MKPIISPISTSEIEAELTPERHLRSTNKGGNEIYVVDGRECPAVMREIGRLREEAFRAAGGGTGESVDIDRFDLMDPPCRQLIVWDPDSRLILGGYRFLLGSEMRKEPDGEMRLAMAHLFHFSEEFERDYLPHTIELGRSFVRLDYQSSRHGVKGIFALDNLWDGLGALTVVYPETRYLFGKMTMYPEYDRTCRDMLLYFLEKHFPDPDRLVWPKHPIERTTDKAKLAGMFAKGGSFKDDYRILNKAIRATGFNIPPLINSYMNLSPTMKMFGTAINDEFGDVEESGILLTIDEIFDEKKERHIDTYKPRASRQ